MPAAAKGGKSEGKAPKDLSYQAAADELDEIVEYFEQSDIDVDQLVAKLERATLLVDELDLRLQKTQMQVDELVPRLQAVVGTTPADAETDD